MQASSSRVNQETYPLASMVTYEFPARGAEVQAHNYHVRGQTGAAGGGVAMPALKAVWYDGGLRPPRPEGLPERVKMGDNRRLLIGDKGFILETKVYPDSRSAEVGAVPKTIPRVADHYWEWAQACMGGLAAGSSFDFADPFAEAVLLGNVALRHELREELTGEKLPWDPVAFRISNCDEANQFLRREYRAGWSL